MQTRLLSPGQIEKMIRRPHLSDESSDRIDLCTVMDLLEVAEDARKQRGQLNLTAFREGWQPVKNQLYVAELDQDCLNRSFFERDQASVVTGIWPLATGRVPGPERTVRRLILRPSVQTWWDDEHFTEMEAWYEDRDDVAS